MKGTSAALTNVTLIRDFTAREGNVSGSRDSRFGRLVERWEAPVMCEEEIEAWATRYRLCPKTGMSFLEYLIVRGVGVAPGVLERSGSTR